MKEVPKSKLEYYQTDEGYSNARNNYSKYLNQCEDTCKYCGYTEIKTDRYNQIHKYGYPFRCKIDYKNRLCEGKCHKYRKRSFLNKIFGFKNDLIAFIDLF